MGKVSVWEEGRSEVLDAIAAVRRVHRRCEFQSCRQAEPLPLCCESARGPECLAAGRALASAAQHQQVATLAIGPVKEHLGAQRMRREEDACAHFLQDTASCMGLSGRPGCPRVSDEHEITPPSPPPTDSESESSGPGSGDQPRCQPTPANVTVCSFVLYNRHRFNRVRFHLGECLCYPAP